MNWVAEYFVKKMGCTNSKTDKNEALRLCKLRRRFIKQAIDSRYALAAAHVSYIQSLRDIGVGLRRYAEAEVLIESSLSISDKTPSHSSLPSPSPSHLAEVSDSPLRNESSFSPSVTTLNYMKSGGTAALTITFNPLSDSYVEEDYPMPPPPPPLPESGSSWDFFDPIDENESFRFVGNDGVDMGFDEMRGWRPFRSEGIDPSLVERKGKWAEVGFERPNEFHEGTSRPELRKKTSEVSGNSVIQDDSSGQSSKEKNDNLITSASNGEGRQLNTGHNTNGQVGSLTGKLTLEQSSSKREKPLAEKDVSAEREDPSEFITHRAKDFLSSIKEIEHRFFRASESGKEVGRMLEANKIRVGYSEAKGN